MSTWSLTGVDKTAGLAVTSCSRRVHVINAWVCRRHSLLFTLANSQENCHDKYTGYFLCTMYKLICILNCVEVGGEYARSRLQIDDNMQSFN